MARIPKIILLVVGSLALTFSSLGRAGVSPEPISSISAEEVTRLRCATDGSDVYTVWDGVVYSVVPNEKQKVLFSIVGMNVARCFKNVDGKWLFSSRELNYYLDSKTGELIHRWNNPWTNEIVPVVHVANNPVQHVFGDDQTRFSVSSAADLLIFKMDVPLTFPNVLSQDSRFAEYSPQPLYQAGEFFTFFAPVAQVMSSKLARAEVAFSWFRTGPWLPWMKMGNREGMMQYSASGKKVAGIADLPEIIRNEIEERLPLYGKAPSCYLNTNNETSWSYFGKHFAKYLGGERFPVAETKEISSCM